MTTIRNELHAQRNTSLTKRTGSRFVNRLPPILACLLLCACANTAPGGRAQVTAPTSISNVYSAIALNLQVGSSESTETCDGAPCQIDQAFERQVRRIGDRLAQSAYATDAALRERVPAFNFTVAAKTEPGSASDAAGTIVIYRGVRNSSIDEEALAFMIGREMGHVIARHHDEKSASTLMASFATQVLMPLVKLSGGVAFAVSTAISTLGANAITDEEEQEQEAEDIALDLLNSQGWTTADIVSSVVAYSKNLGDDEWSQALKSSLRRYGPVNLDLLARYSITD